jgi:hypothetical protein|nr:MAG TPA: hypothetical protein [Caudoviricetes sp.]
MPRLHCETINTKPVTFYVEDDGVIWIRAFALLQAAGIKAPGAALNSYLANHPGTGEKFNYPPNAVGSAGIKITSAAWHFTYAEALEFLKASRAPGRIKARKAVDSTVKMLTAAYLAPAPVKPAKTAKAKPAPVKTESPYTATIDRLTAILTDTTQPPYIQLKALNARTFLLELERETCND